MLYRWIQVIGEIVITMEVRDDFVIDVSQVRGDIYVRPPHEDRNGPACGIALD